MITFLSVLFLGFFLGMRHATDSDHVVAVTTIVSRQRSIRGAALTGMFWGVGHSLTVLVAGGAIVLLGVVVPERLGLSLELCVALMLVLLGAMNLRSMLQWLREGNFMHRHRHGHRDAGTPVFGRVCEPVVAQPEGLQYASLGQRPRLPTDKLSSPERAKERYERVLACPFRADTIHRIQPRALPWAGISRPFGPLCTTVCKCAAGFGTYQLLRPVVIGVVHGLAGSAAVALLVLPMIHSPTWAMAYLLIFGAGTIAGMMLVTAAIALPITYAAARAPLFQRYVGATAGMFSVGFGVFLFWHIGFVEGLFTR